MADLIQHPVSSALLLLSLAVLVTNCGRTSHEEPEEHVSPPSAGAGGDAPPSSGGGGAGQAGSTSVSGATSASGTSGSESSPGGAPAIDPGVGALHCAPQDEPGSACNFPRCWGDRCGVHFELTCVNGVWDSRGSSLAWELVCPVPGSSVSDVGDIEQGACCGKTLPRNDVHSEPPSCNLCPDLEPRDGEPCSLPDDCAPALIDCFYKCCCYGNVTWAQCDGKQWHVATNCSGK